MFAKGRWGCERRRACFFRIEEHWARGTLFLGKMLDTSDEGESERVVTEYLARDACCEASGFRDRLGALPHQQPVTFKKLVSFANNAPPLILISAVETLHAGMSNSIRKCVAHRKSSKRLRTEKVIGQWRGMSRTHAKDVVTRRRLRSKTSSLANSFANKAARVAKEGMADQLKQRKQRSLATRRHSPHFAYVQHRMDDWKQMHSAEKLPRARFEELKRSFLDEFRNLSDEARGDWSIRAKGKREDAARHTEYRERVREESTRAHADMMTGTRGIDSSSLWGIAQLEPQRPLATSLMADFICELCPDRRLDLEELIGKSEVSPFSLSATTCA